MTSRRRFLALTGAVGISQVALRGQLSPALSAETPSRTPPYRVLSVLAAQALDALGDTMLPGAASAGLSHYIDGQLRLPACDQVLMIRYLGLAPPFASFYTAGLDALDKLAYLRSGKRFAELPANIAAGLVAALAMGSPEHWKGPPPSLFYFALRNDAVDVVYGTERGFSALGVPYMAHISPPADWPT
jgi:gluconate 2-dehydrogenase subunit 3-like protein